MNILFVGVLDVPWSTNVEMKKALIELGHQVDSFNYRSIADNHIPAWQRNAIFTVFFNKLFSLFRRLDWLPKGMRGLYFSILGRRVMHNLLMEQVGSKNYDLVLLAKTDTVNPATIAEISRHVNTWYYFMDPMDQVDRITAAWYATSATYASASFSDVWELFLQHNPNSHWMTQGIDPDTFYPLEGVEKTIDVMFAGTRTAKREEYLQKIRERGIKVTCYGAGWENTAIYQSELVNKYRQSRIVLNLCRDGRGFSVRVFQVLGTGSFLLSEYCEDLEQIFEKGKHLDWAETAEEMADKVQHYLNHYEEREAVAIEGCSFVYKEKTWNKLMSALLKEMEKR